jgi:hypothetical protein
LYYKTFLADSMTEPADLGPLAGYSPLVKDAGKPSGLAGMSGVGNEIAGTFDRPLESVVPSTIGQPAARSDVWSSVDKSSVDKPAPDFGSTKPPFSEPRP